MVLSPSITEALDEIDPREFDAVRGDEGLILVVDDRDVLISAFQEPTGASYSDGRMQELFGNRKHRIRNPIDTDDETERPDLFLTSYVGADSLNEIGDALGFTTESGAFQFVDCDGEVNDEGKIVALHYAQHLAKGEVPRGVNPRFMNLAQHDRRMSDHGFGWKFMPQEVRTQIKALAAYFSVSNDPVQGANGELYDIKDFIGLIDRVSAGVTSLGVEVIGWGSYGERTSRVIKDIIRPKHLEWDGHVGDLQRLMSLAPRGMDAPNTSRRDIYRSVIRSAAEAKIALEKLYPTPHESRTQRVVRQVVRHALAA